MTLRGWLWRHNLWLGNRVEIRAVGDLHPYWQARIWNDWKTSEDWHLSDPALD